MENCEGLVYKERGYDSLARRYRVFEYKNGVPLYEYKGKIEGNKVTLHPYRRILATEDRTRPIEIPTQSLKRG